MLCPTKYTKMLHERLNTTKKLRRIWDKDWHN
jgi:hypothetical protein